MKKMMISLVFLMGSFAVSYGGEGDKVKIGSKDTLKTEIGFELSAGIDKTLHIDLTGITGELSSISLVDQRGSAVVYKFIENENSSFDFNLENINPGIYYVKLNLGNEIRMKMVVIE